MENLKEYKKDFEKIIKRYKNIDINISDKEIFEELKEFLFKLDNDQDFIKKYILSNSFEKTHYWYWSDMTKWIRNLEKIWIWELLYFWTISEIDYFHLRVLILKKLEYWMWNLWSIFELIWEKDVLLEKLKNLVNEKVEDFLETFFYKDKIIQKLIDTLWWIKIESFYYEWDDLSQQYLIIDSEVNNSYYFKDYDEILLDIEHLDWSFDMKSKVIGKIINSENRKSYEYCSILMNNKITDDINICILIHKRINKIKKFIENEFLFSLIKNFFKENKIIDLINQDLEEYFDWNFYENINDDLFKDLVFNDIQCLKKIYWIFLELDIIWNYHCPFSEKFSKESKELIWYWNVNIDLMLNNFWYWDYSEWYIKLISFIHEEKFWNRFKYLNHKSKIFDLIWEEKFNEIHSKISNDIFMKFFNEIKEKNNELLNFKLTYSEWSCYRTNISFKDFDSTDHIFDYSSKIKYPCLTDIILNDFDNWRFEINLIKWSFIPHVKIELWIKLENWLKKKSDYKIFYEAMKEISSFLRNIENTINEFKWIKDHHSRMFEWWWTLSLILFESWFFKEWDYKDLIEKLEKEYDDFNWEIFKKRYSIEEMIEKFSQ